MKLRFAALLVASAAVCGAAVVRMEVAERSEVLGGKAFGNAGAYERLVGKAYFEVDPKAEANGIVSDIGLGPVNGRGMVEFSADFYVLRPKNAAKGNHAVLMEIPNRGGKGMLGVMDRAAGGQDPRSAEQFGDGYLLEEGYTLVWVGWQFDVPRREGLMRLYAPVAKGVEGLVRSEFIPDRKVTKMPLADREHGAYPVVKAGDLTVRDRVLGERRTIAKSGWRLDGDSIVYGAGFEPGKIYEFVYTSKDPVLVGLGLAAVRDVVSFYKYAKGGEVVAAYGFGISQSGRFLRKFVYDGFNADEKGRKVFDGILAHVAGGGMGGFNHRFAQPSRDGHPFLNTLYPTDLFPYTDEDGILARAKKTNTVPKIFYTNSSYEYWGRSAALISTAVDGKGDAKLAEGTRIYFFAGGQHGPAPFPPPQHDTQNASSPVAYTWALRAMLRNMNSWVQGGAEPPVSQYPRVGADNLVPIGAIQFPKIPGVGFPAIARRAYDLDFGPEFVAGKVDTVEPPRVRGTRPLLLPQVDADGTDKGGIRMPEVAVPLATYTGWNLRSASIGAADELYSMQGSFIPFARTKAEREAKGDPRLSIAERYAGREEYLARVQAAAEKLAKDGYLLSRDVAKVVERSGEEWDALTKMP